MLTLPHPLPKDAVIAHLQGGLGNQMFQYAAVSAAAARSGRPLYLDPLSLRQGLRSYELGTFPVQATVLEGRAADSVPRPESRWPWRRRRPGIARIVEQRMDFDDELASLPPRVWVTGYWQSPLYFEDRSQHLRETFALARVPQTPRLLGHAEQLVDRDDTVAVHVRRGDYADPEVQKVHGLLPLEYFEEGRARARADGGRQEVVFSDDIAWAQEQLRWPDALFVPPGPAHEDLLLMASCARHVISNSSFSWWAAWLADRPFVVAPQRWGSSPRLQSSTLLPPRWLRL